MIVLMINELIHAKPLRYSAWNKVSTQVFFSFFINMISIITNVHSFVHISTVLLPSIKL